MRILVINPNTTASMTEKIGVAASEVAGPQTEIVARNPATGPASIQGPEDGAAALPGLFFGGRFNVVRLVMDILQVGAAATIIGLSVLPSVRDTVE